MTPTAVGAAVMFTMAMLLVVVAASYVGIEFQRSVDQRFNGVISTAGNAAIEIDRSCCQGLSCPAANTTGNDGIDFLGLQEPYQGTVSLTIRADDIGFDDIPVFDIINLELRRMTEMLEYLPIFIRNGYSHHINFSSHLQ